MPKVNVLFRVAVCLLLVFLPLHSLDQWLYDQLFQLRGSRTGPTSFLLVRVNDAKLYRQLEMNSTDFPKENLLFSPPTHGLWIGDFYLPLLEALSAGKPETIVFTTFFNGVLGEPAPRFPKIARIFSSALNPRNMLVPPPVALAAGDTFGFSSLFPDPDNVVRRGNLVYSSGRSLALRIHHQVLKTPVQRDLLEPLRIDFRGPEGSYPSVEAEDILADRVDLALFKDRILLVGYQGSPASNQETPFGPMSPLEIQANIADTFLSDREITVLPRWVSWILSGLAVAVSVTIIFVFPLTLAWVFLLLFALLLVLITLFFFSQFQWWAGLGNPIFCIFGTHLLMLGYKLSRQEEHQWRIQQEAKTLKEMDQFKNNFISLFSHDLKTPISKIRAITNRLLGSGRENPPELEQDLKAIDRTNTELARLIGDILKVTKMETMSLEPNKEVIDLNRMVEVAAGRLSFLAEEKGVIIIKDLEPLFSMEGDANLIQEVITNLLENAIKYSYPKGQVVVQTREHEREVQVSIRDEGQGIAADELPRVTGKFYRGRRNPTDIKGSGLGLYLAKYFVELHRGRLDIHSEEGRGTTVSFSLPLPD